MLRVEERPRYVSDGKVAWSRLPALIALSLVAAMALAWVLKTAFFYGWYWIIILPALGGLALGGVLFALVGWSKCRNRWLAAVLGIAAGSVGYLGYYHLCLVEALPLGLEWRVDLLPYYIQFRMETDVQEEVGGPNNNPPQNPSQFMNWFTFVWELSMVVGAAGGCCWYRAGRAYAPELRQWMRREKALLQSGTEHLFREALDQGQLAEFVDRTPLGSDPQSSPRLVIEHAKPTDQSLLEYPVYLSLEGPQSTRLFDRFRMGRGRIRQIKLETGEVLALRPYFPELTRLLAEQHDELRDLPPGTRPADVAVPIGGETAEITPVPEPYHQRVRSKGYAIWVNLLGLTPLVYFAGGAGLAGLGGWLAVEKGMTLAWLAVPVGVVGFAFGAYMGLYCLCVPENRWINRRLRREISQRPDPLVDSRDPEAVFVSLIPRESFAKIQLTMSTDLLLLKIDEQGKRVLMEGDSDRYRIPGGAVSVCEPECFFHPIDAQHQNELWMVRMMVHVKDGIREILLSADPTQYTPTTNARRHKTAEELCQRINALRTEPLTAESSVGS